MSPLVSICITTYNRSELLLKTLESALKQDYENFEIIIIDDHSDVSAQEVIESSNIQLGSKVKIYRNDINKGLAASRNVAIQVSSGKYFCFCDDDDYLRPNYVSTFVNLAEKIGAGWCLCSPSTNGMAEAKPFAKKTGYLSDFILAGYTPPVASQFYRLNDLKAISGYDERIKSGVDHDLWLRLSYTEKKLKVLDSTLAYPNAFSEHHPKMTNKYKSRKDGITRALGIWESGINKFYGYDFFEHFEKEYLLYIYSRFLKQSLRDGDFVLTFKVIKDAIKDNLILQLPFRVFLDWLKNRLSKRSLPLFQGFNK